jgi:hypothetical protein
MNSVSDPSFDVNSLYREDLYSDRRVGTIRQLTPVRGDGSTDPTRAVSYVGQISVMTPMGTLPISFEIPATDLTGAAEGFAEAAKVAMDETMRELAQMRREAASSIIVPETGAAPAPGGRIRIP